MFSRILPAAFLAPLIAVAVGVPASATTMGTQDGNETQGCEVAWNAASTLNTRLTNSDPEFPDLMVGLDGQSVGTYDKGGNIRSVRPAFDDSPGILTVRHAYSGTIDSTEGADGDIVDTATEDTVATWRVIIATDNDIADARLVFTAPLGTDWQVSSGEDLSSAGTPMSSYTWTDTRAEAMMTTPLTWDLPLGGLAAGEGVVVQFDAEVREGEVLSENNVAEATLTGTYDAGIEDCLSPSPSTSASASSPSASATASATAPEASALTARSEAPTTRQEAAPRTATATPATATGTMPQTGAASTLPLIRTAAILLAVGSVVLLLTEWRRRLSARRGRGRGPT